MLNKIDLVVLAGGRGSRIKKFLNKKPKPLYKFNGVSFLQLILNHFLKFPFQNCYILAGYKGEMIKKIFNNKIINFVPIKCLIEKKSLGTAGAVFQLKKIIKNDFLLINGDSILLENINNIFLTKPKKHLIYLVQNKNYKSNNKLSNLVMKKNNIYEGRGNYMNAGVIYFKKKIFREINQNNFSLEEEVVPKLIRQKKIMGLISKNFFIDIGTEKNLLISKIKLPSILKFPSAFLDRDGVINEDLGYVHEIKKFKLRMGVLEGLKKLIKKKYNIFIITNQAGVAKKKFSEKKLIIFHRYLKFFFAKNNIHFNDVQYCPYHVEALIKKYRKQSILRKPKNGMIKVVERKFFIDKQKSFALGDKISDKIAFEKSNLYFEYAKKNFYTQISNILKKKLNIELY